MDFQALLLILNVQFSILTRNYDGLKLGKWQLRTQNFLQWYVAEQLEEEALARTIIDRLNMIGNDKAGLYLFDRDLTKEMPQEPHL